MKNVFDPAKRYNVVMCCKFDNNAIPSTLPGHFEPDTLEIEGELSREKYFAVFHVDEPQGRTYPAHYVGVYRIPMGHLQVFPPQEIP
jgi:hypothetical protein